MFRSTARSLRTWWTDFSDDILGADLPQSVYAEELEDEFDADLDYHRSHAHRQPLSAPRPRRDGTVAARPAHCLSPVRSPDRSGTAHHVVR